MEEQLRHKKDRIKSSKLFLIGDPERDNEIKGREVIFEEIMTKFSHN